MLDFSTIDEASWRLGFFVGVFALMALWEAIYPRRERRIPRLLRWSNNIAIVLLNTLVLRLTFPLLATGMAVIAHTHSFGLFNLLELPFWLACVLSFLLLDLAIYLQHVVFHKVPVLWRLHRMHHADLEIDVTTGSRFHPVEIVLSMSIKLAIVALLGAPAIAVLIFEIVLNACAMFNHSNARLPLTVDKYLRLILVTPDMHRVHHSVLREETDSNFGFNMPWWDRLFGTYRDQPKAGHDNMEIGIEVFRTNKDLRIDQMLIQPLKD